MTRVNDGPSVERNFTHANPEGCSIPLDERCGIQRFKHVEHNHCSPRELDEPVTDKVPNKGAGVEVGWNDTGQGRGEGDVDE